MQLIIFLSLSIFSVINVHSGKVPVFLLDFQSVLSHIMIEPNPFFTVDTSTFNEVINEAVKNSKTVIMFVEERFSTEDISSKGVHGSPFYYLKQGLTDGKVKYIPKVTDPYKTLKLTFAHRKSNVLYMTSDNNRIQIHNGRQKHFYIYFKDPTNETRAITLRRHDFVMNEVYNIIQRTVSGPIVAFYTGKTNPIVVKKTKLLPIKPVPEKRVHGITIASSGALFRLIGKLFEPKYLEKPLIHKN